MLYAPAPAATALANLVQCKQFTLNLSQAAGTYDLCTASGGHVSILDIAFYNDVAGVGLTSLTAQTNDTTPTTVLASVLLAALTGGKNLTPYAGPLVLASTKKIQYTTVGIGAGGSIQAIVRFMAPAGGTLA